MKLCDIVFRTSRGASSQRYPTPMKYLLYYDAWLIGRSLFSKFIFFRSPVESHFQKKNKKYSIWWEGPIGPASARARDLVFPI